MTRRRAHRLLYRLTRRTLRVHLSNDTKITLGTAVAVVSISISATWWFSARLAEFRSEIRALSTRLEQTDTAIPKMYSLAAASEQALRLAIENPGLRVPDPRDPNTIIAVNDKPNGRE